MKDNKVSVVDTNSKKEDDIAKLMPEILLAGEKSDLLGLTEPAHMCSNCWNNKVVVTPGGGN